MSDSNMTVAEVVQMAVNMETKGMHFYNWVSKQFDVKEVKDIFIRLSEEEKDHVRVFKKLLEMPDTEQKLGAGTGKFMKLIGASGDIFPHHSDVSDMDINSPVEALAVGIQAEKDAILLYQELYNQTESQEVKKTLSKLLEEEKMHLLELRDYMDELRDFKQ